MTRREYIVGQLVELFVTITDPHNADAPIDDPTASVTVYLPDGTTDASASVTHGGTGEYTANYTPTMAGAYRYVWDADTAATGKGRGHFYVSNP